MVVSQAGVVRYRNQKLRDSSKWKELPDEELDRRIAKWGFDFHTEPWRHQKICWLLGAIHPAYLFLLDMSAGKTKLGLDLGRVNCGRILVLVPNAVNIGEWYDEAAKHAPDLKVLGLEKALVGSARLHALTDERWDVVVGTYQGVLALLSKSVTHKRKRRGKEKGWALDHPKIRKVGASFRTVIFDEVTALKSHTSLYYTLARALGKVVRHRYGLTGTPFDRDPQDLWAEFFAVDRGEALGKTLGLFREAFFIESENYWGGRNYAFQTKRKAELHRRLRHSSIRFDEEEIGDMPTAVGGLVSKTGPRTRKAAWGKEQLEYYSRAKSDFLEARGNFEVMKASYMNLRTIESGWLAYRNDEGRKVYLDFVENPKLDAAIETIRELGPKEKVVLVHIFKHTGQLIADRLAKEKISHCRIYSKSKNKHETLKTFRKPDGPQVLLGSESIAFGINLQHTARWTLFLESPDSGIRRKQLERRTRRRSGRWKRYYYLDFLIRGGIGEKILEGLISDQPLFKSLVDGRLTPTDLLK